MYLAKAVLNMLNTTIYFVINDIFLAQVAQSAWFGTCIVRNITLFRV